MNAFGRSLAVRLALVLAVTLPLAASAQDKKDSGRSPKDSKSTKDKRRRSKPPKPIPELEIYPLGPDEFREFETREMIALAQHLYKPDPGETAVLEAKIHQIQEQRWQDAEKISEFRTLLAERSRLFQEVIANVEQNVTPRKKLRELQRHKEFAGLLTDLRKYERKHPNRFLHHAEQIESVLDPAKVDEARREWNSRVRESRKANQLRELIQGLGRRKWPKTTPSKSDEKPESPAPVKSQEEPKPQTAPKEAGKPQSPQKAIPARPLDQWETYVRDFIQKYELTQTQSNAAMSILADIQSRASLVEKRNQGQIAAAQNIADSKERKQRLAELEAPTQQLFRELSRRLDRLLTGAQRNKATAK